MAAMMKGLLMVAVAVTSFRVRANSRRLNLNHRLQASAALTSQSSPQANVAEEVAAPDGPPLPARVVEVAQRQAETEPEEPDDKTLMQTIAESSLANGLPPDVVRAYTVRIQTMMCLIFTQLLGHHAECDPFVDGENTKQIELSPRDRQRVVYLIQIGIVVRESQPHGVRYNQILATLLLTDDSELLGHAGDAVKRVAFGQVNTGQGKTLIACLVALYTHYSMKADGFRPAIGILTTTETLTVQSLDETSDIFKKAAQVMGGGVELKVCIFSSESADSFVDFDFIYLTPFELSRDFANFYRKKGGDDKPPSLPWHHKPNLEDPKFRKVIIVDEADATAYDGVGDTYLSVKGLPKSQLLVNVALRIAEACWARKTFTGRELHSILGLPPSVPVRESKRITTSACEDPAEFAELRAEILAEATSSPREMSGRMEREELGTVSRHTLEAAMGQMLSQLGNSRMYSMADLHGKHTLTAILKWGAKIFDGREGTKGKGKEHVKRLIESGAMPAFGELTRLVPNPLGCKPEDGDWGLCLQYREFVEAQIDRWMMEARNLLGTSPVLLKDKNYIVRGTGLCGYLELHGGNADKLHDRYSPVEKDGRCKDLYDSLMCGGVKGGSALADQLAVRTRVIWCVTEWLRKVQRQKAQLEQALSGEEITPASPRQQRPPATPSVRRVISTGSSREPPPATPVRRVPSTQSSRSIPTGSSNAMTTGKGRPSLPTSSPKLSWKSVSGADPALQPGSPRSVRSRPAGGSGANWNLNQLAANLAQATREKVAARRTGQASSLVESNSSDSNLSLQGGRPFFQHEVLEEYFNLEQRLMRLSVELQRLSQPKGRNPLATYNQDAVTLGSNSTEPEILQTIRKEISYAPVVYVDYVNGPIRPRMRFNGFKHLFLEYRHNGAILTMPSSETLALSRICALEGFDIVLGFTGTLPNTGSQVVGSTSAASRTLLEQEYATFNGIMMHLYGGGTQAPRLFYVSPFAPSQMIIKEPHIRVNRFDEKWPMLRSEVLSIRDRQCILIVVPDINTAHLVASMLSKEFPSVNVFIGDGFDDWVPKKVWCDGDIVVTTAVGSRGVDWQCTAIWGFEVIATYMSESFRVQRQIMGRTARKKLPGTYVELTTHQELSGSPQVQGKLQSQLILKVITSLQSDLQTDMITFMGEWVNAESEKSQKKDEPIKRYGKFRLWLTDRRYRSIKRILKGLIYHSGSPDSGEWNEAVGHLKAFFDEFQVAMELQGEDRSAARPPPAEEPRRGRRAPTRVEAEVVSQVLMTTDQITEAMAAKVQNRAAVFAYLRGAVGDAKAVQQLLANADNEGITQTSLEGDALRYALPPDAQ